MPPEKIPWNALCTLLSQCIYGGRIDNDFDQVFLHHVISDAGILTSFHFYLLPLLVTRVEIAKYLCEDIFQHQEL